MEEEEQEAAAPVIRKSPVVATAAMIEEHEILVHVVYRDWCRHCVAARGVGQQHRSQPKDDELAIAKISCDYAFMYQGEGDTMPILVIYDSKTKSYSATTVKEKGVEA
jgi:hypothetical protein